MSGKRKASYHLRHQHKRPKKGLTLPGYNNLGPFNDPNIPLTKSDADSLIHDDNYKRDGKRSYWTFTQADQDYLNGIEKETDYGARLAKKYFTGKKKLAEWGILPADPLQSKVKENPLLDFHKNTGNAPLTRARKKALERQQRITDTFKSKKYRPDKQSVLNLQSTRQATEPMADGKGSGNPTGLTETPVDQVVDVERGVSSYQFASLPWNAIYFAEETKTTATDIAYRMTSPYDVSTARAVTDKNPNATGVQNEKTISTDASDATQNKAMWYDFYAGMYKYYHVVGCKYNILIENMGNEPFWVHKMFCTDRLPPTAASNMDMLSWPDNEPHFVPAIMGYVDQNGLKNSQLTSGYQTKTKSQDPQANGNYVAGQQINSNRSNILQLSGQYSTGDVTHDIRLDSDVENWTTVTTNPKLREILLLRFKPETSRYRTTDQATDAGRTIRYKLTIKLEYLVEFKELKDELKWPVSYQPLTVTVTPATNTDSSMTDE